MTQLDAWISKDHEHPTLWKTQSNQKTTKKNTNMNVSNTSKNKNKISPSHNVVTFGDDITLHVSGVSTRSFNY